MKVLGIICSPRKQGNTEILVREALTGVMETGAETEALMIRDKQIKPCDACLACETDGVCHIEDDMHLIYEKMMESDGIIIGTPVYFWSMSAQAKILIDRTYALRYPHLRLAHKVAGAIAVAARSGAVSTLNTLQRYFVGNHMFTVDLVDGLARERGEITRDKRGLKSAYEMGRQIALLLKQHPRFPEEFDVPLYTFVYRKYKTPRYPVLE